MPRKPQQPDPAQFEMDGVFQEGPSIQNVTVQRVAQAMGVSENQVRAWVDAGMLHVKAINDSVVPLSRKGEVLPKESLREHIRISRFSAVGLNRFLELKKDSEVCFYRLTPEATRWLQHLQTKFPNDTTNNK